MSYDILPFTEDMLSEAGHLFARRHQHNRQVSPELPARFEDPAVATGAVKASLSRDHASGVAAMDGDRLLGYLVGDLVIDAQWGRSAWVRLPGCALAPGISPELVRDLYAALAAPWVASGCFTHLAVMPTADPALLQIWYSLSFGIEQVYGLRSLKALDLSHSPLPPGLEICRATSADRETLADMYDLIWRQNVSSPVWGLHLPENDDELRDAYGDLVDDPNATVWLAFLDGVPAGFQCYFPGEQAADSLLVPDDCTVLEVAGTHPQFRGQGIGSLLTRTGLSYAYANGYRTCLADWRSANLLASRFWPSQGFRPAAYRLARRVDPRIAWGNGRPLS
jgi:ribosomal protein S18 acetylase RimI-like enzyme